MQIIKFNKNSYIVCLWIHRWYRQQNVTLRWPTIQTSGLDMAIHGSMDGIQAGCNFWTTINPKGKHAQCACSENSRILFVTAAPPCPPCLMKPTFVLNYTMLIVAKAILKVIEPPWVLHGCSMGLALKLIIYILTIFQVQMNIHTFFGIALALYSLLHWAQITAAPDWHLPDIPDFRVRVT